MVSGFILWTRANWGELGQQHWQRRLYLYALEYFYVENNPVIPFRFLMILNDDSVIIFVYCIC